MSCARPFISGRPPGQGDSVSDTKQTDHVRRKSACNARTNSAGANPLRYGDNKTPVPFQGVHSRNVMSGGEQAGMAELRLSSVPLHRAAQAFFKIHHGIVSQACFCP